MHSAHMNRQMQTGALLAAPHVAIPETYSPRRRVPHYLKHSHRAAENAAVSDLAAHEEMQRQAAKTMAMTERTTSPSSDRPTPTPSRLRKVSSLATINGTRAYFEQSAVTSKEAMALQLQSPMRGRNKATTMVDTPAVQQQRTFLSPATLNPSLQQTPINTSHSSSFISTPAFNEQSFASTSSGSGDRSLGSSFHSVIHGFTSPSPIHPHHLSFESESTPPNTSSSNTTPSPLAPFPFAGLRSPVDGAQMSSFPPLAPSQSMPTLFSSQPTPISSHHVAQPRAAARFISPVALALDSPSTPSTGGSTSSTPIPLKGTGSSSSADSPALMALGSTPPPNLALNPFVSPVAVRVVGLNGGIKSGHGRQAVNLMSPSPLAPVNVLCEKTKKHVRMRSMDGASAATSSSSTLPTSRRNTSLLNAKRSRGHSMDLEAELDAGAEILPASTSPNSKPYTMSNFSSAQPECPSEAITQSMRKLKVKKSMPESPAFIRQPEGTAQRMGRQRRNSGFSSSEDEDDSSMGISAASTPIDVAPGTQNMKQLRRAKQLQSVQKKRQQMEQEALEMAALQHIHSQEDRMDDMDSPLSPCIPPHHRPTNSLEAALEAAKHASSTRPGHNYSSSTGSVDSLASPSRKATQGLHISIPTPLVSRMNGQGIQLAKPTLQTSPNIAILHGHDMVLDSPPSVHHALGDQAGRALSFASDDEEDNSRGERTTKQLSFDLLPASSTTATPLRPLPPCEDDLVAMGRTQPLDDGVGMESSPARVLDFGAAVAEGNTRGSIPFASLADAEDQSERGDECSDLSIHTLSRGGSFRMDLSHSSGGFFGSSSSTPQQRALTSPVPQHTPLTPAPFTHSLGFTFHLPHATPLPVLPGMELPKSRVTSASKESCSSDPMASPATDELPGAMDFLSPVNSSTSFVFPTAMMQGATRSNSFCPSMSPLSASGSYSLDGCTPVDRSLLSPTPLSGDASLGSAASGTGVSVFEPMVTRALSDSMRTPDGCTTPTSPPSQNSFLAAPSQAILFALSPDPKAFAEQSSLAIRKTPARGKLQPPPTPIRPTSIKRSAGPKSLGLGLPTATPSKPSRMGQTSAKLLALALPDGAVNGSSDNGVDTPPHAATSTTSHLPSSTAPTYLPPLRGGRLERTSSLFDSKVLIDFKAHLAAAQHAKKKLLAESGGEVHEEGGADLDVSMDGSEGDSSFTLHSNLPSSANSQSGTSSNLSLTVSNPVCPQPSSNISIWETQFTNKVLVGSGSFFQTYRCESCAEKEHPDEFGKFFAVKRSIKEFRGKKDRGLYLREIAVMEQIGDHENIVKHIRAWQEDLHFYLQMEFCPMNLSQYVTSLQQAALSATTPRGGCMSPSSNPYILNDALLKNITLQLASALHHIHERDLIHLDVKPDNVLVSAAGILRLADFGQARIIKPGVGDDWDMDGVEGDCVFMAPELLDPSSSGLSGPTPAADIFSLGLLLVELASGVSLPKSGPTWSDLRQGRAHLHIHNRVSKQMEHIILNLLEPKPHKRPTAKVLLEWLQSHHEEAWRHE